MSITTVRLTNSVLAGYNGIARYFQRDKKNTLIDALVPTPPAALRPQFANPLGAAQQTLLQTADAAGRMPPAIKAQSVVVLQQLDDRYQRLIHNTIDRLFGEQYEKHLKALDGANGLDGIPPIVKQRNREAGYAGVSLLLYLSGAPLLMTASIGINLYLGWVMIKIGLRDMQEKRTLTARGRNILVYVGCLVSGLVVVQSAFLVLSLLTEKLIDTVQGQSHERLVNLFGTLPQTVWYLREGVVVSAPLNEIQAGDVVVVHAGEVVPVDGVILSGQAGIDQHMLTGEAQPVDKEAGDTVFASTLVLMGEIRVQVEKANADTLAAQITTILNNTRSHQTQMGLQGVQIADRLVYATTAIGLLALPLWGVSSMLAVWSVSLGTMLMFSTPLTLLAYLDVSARSNILVKDGRSLELLSGIDTVLFDKTGTLTLEQPTLCAVHGVGELSEEEVLALAAAIEQHQSHPIAAAIRQAASERALPLPAVDETRIEVGYGLAVMFNGQRVLLGSQRFMTLNAVPLTADVQELAQQQQISGHSLVYLAVDGLLQGMLELQPTVRPEAQAIVSALHTRGMQLAMITGDQEAPAQALAAALGIDRVFANVLPEQKAELVKELQAQGRKVIFVGDGINDSIALKQAHVSVSIAGATTVATDTAQIVLMDGSLGQLDTLFDLSARYENDLRKQFILGVYIPAGYIGGVLLWGWGMVSSYIVGNIIFLTANGLAFRLIWQQERLESQLQLKTEPASQHLLMAATE